MLRLSDAFVYDETSPTCLRWKTDRFKGKGHTQKFISAGDVAGCINGCGYFQVSLNRELFLVHRVVFELLHGPIPETAEVDHQDRVKTNNKGSNLRLTSKSGNQRNKSKQQNNTSGITGVTFYKTRDKTGEIYTYVKATLKLKDEILCRNFSVKKFGLLPAFAAAVQARDEMMKTTREGEEPYAPSHGK